jgi:small subunit ribosomal protein S8
MHSDPISDMLTRIRNALHAGRKRVEIPHSRLKAEIAGLLKREGYLEDVVVGGEGVRKSLELVLKYQAGKVPCIRGIRRVSTPGLRRYASTREMPRVLGGLGIAILSTSQGLMTDREARRRKVGGEVLCYVW